MSERLSLLWKEEFLNDISLIQMRFYHVCPLKMESGVLYLAISKRDPDKEENLRFVLKRSLRFIVYLYEEIEELIQIAEQKNISLLETSPEDYVTDELKVCSKEEGTMSRFVDLLFAEAVDKRASDIHIEPMSHSIVIRFRIDGVLQEMMNLPLDLIHSLVSRLKLMAHCDISEKRIPQDGSLSLVCHQKSVDVRFSSVPTSYGESVVLRVLDQSLSFFKIDSIGMTEREQKLIQKVLSLPNGLILVTGATGSGKTTTLYSFLHQISQKNKKIISIEEPVEYRIKGVDQVDIRPKIGLTFSQVLRASLRQSPDVVMIGEIRDRPVAQVAMQASLTGHLVLSSLHTNDSMGAVIRLMDMGIQPYLLASSLKVVVAQRLLRKLCLSCRQIQEKVPQNIWDILGDGLYREEIFYRPQGCQYCLGTGYKGRVGIFEVLYLNDELKEVIFNRHHYQKLVSVARLNGLVDLKTSAMRQAVQGVTSLDEVVRCVI